MFIIRYKTNDQEVPPDARRNFSIMANLRTALEKLVTQAQANKINSIPGQFNLQFIKKEGRQ